ncbi:hypothetical protein [Leeuwenhoekiella palythoae]|uniref:hypothetical protein n=1 Tax=Leeuwenhoekiella palythoae TaxID=573501 RepID=UPI00093521B6|nr:hypothetical protein [Leeuwenhoekiella palythoae]
MNTRYNRPATEEEKKRKPFGYEYLIPQTENGKLFDYFIHAIQFPIYIGTGSAATEVRWSIGNE